MFAFKNREDLENLVDRASIKSQLKELHLQERLDKRNFHENKERLQEPLIDRIKNTSENLTQTITEASINNNKAIEVLNNKVLELMKDKLMIAP